VAKRWAGLITAAADSRSSAFIAYGKSVPVMNATEKKTKIKVGSTRMPTIVARLLPIDVYWEPPSRAASAVTKDASASTKAPPRMSPYVAPGSGYVVRTGISVATVA
jgi:hypothetical protein